MQQAEQIDNVHTRLSDLGLPEITMRRVIEDQIYLMIYLKTISDTIANEVEGMKRYGMISMISMFSTSHSSVVYQSNQINISLFH